MPQSIAEAKVAYDAAKAKAAKSQSLVFQLKQEADTAKTEYNTVITVTAPNLVRAAADKALGATDKLSAAISTAQADSGALSQAKLDYQAAIDADMQTSAQEVV